MVLNNHDDNTVGQNDKVYPTANIFWRIIANSNKLDRTESACMHRWYSVLHRVKSRKYSKWNIETQLQLVETVYQSEQLSRLFFIFIIVRSL